MAPIPHRIILLKEINEKVTQRSLLSIILSAYIYEKQSQSGSENQKVIAHGRLHRQGRHQDLENEVKVFLKR